MRHSTENFVILKLELIPSKYFGKLLNIYLVFGFGRSYRRKKTLRKQLKFLIINHHLKKKTLKKKKIEMSIILENLNQFYKLHHSWIIQSKKFCKKTYNIIINIFNFYSESFEISYKIGI